MPDEPAPDFELAEGDGAAGDFAVQTKATLTPGQTSEGLVRLVSSEGQVTFVEPAAVDASVGDGEVWRVETDGEAAARHMREGEAAEYSSTAETVRAFGEGGLRGMTFGLSDLVLGDAEAEARRRINPIAAGAGMVIGELAPVLVTGGQSTMARLAQLSPAGRVAAMTARMAEGAPRSLIGRIGGGVAAGIVDGAAAGAGQVISEAALREDVDFSADALALGMARGAALGGVVGGGLAALLGPAERGLERLLVDDAATVVQKKAPRARKAPRAASVYRKVRKAREVADDEVLPLEQVVGGQLRRDAPGSLGKLAAIVDDAATSQRPADLMARLADPRVAEALPGADLVAVRSNAEKLVAEYTEAAADAKRWAGEYAEAFGATNVAELTPAQLARQVPDELEERGAVALARLDEARAKLDAVVDDLEAVAPDPARALAAEAAEAGPAGLLERAQQAAGAIEIAGQFGIGEGLPGLRRIPVIGEAVAMYLKFKAGAAALSRRGLLPSTPTARAAAGVNQLRSDLARRVGRTVSRAAGSPITPRAISKVARQIRETPSPEQAAEKTRAELAGLPPDIQEAAARSAGRVAQYLATTAPPNLLEGSPSKAKRPSRSEAHDYQRRRRAAYEPLKALDDAIAGPFAMVEAEALGACYPALFAQIQRELEGQRDRLARRLSPGRLTQISLAFQVVLTVDMAEGYAQPPPMPQLDPAPEFGSPSASTTSPLVQEATRER